MVEGEVYSEGSCTTAAKDLRIAYLALNAAFDSIIVHRLDGTLVYFNAAAAEMHGATMEEFAALPPWGWTHYTDPAVREERMRFICAEGSHSFRSSRELADGRMVHMEVHARCVESEGGLIIVAVVRDVSEQVRATELLETLAFHDPLTGLANRALFDESLSTAIASARRHGDLLGLVYLDLDDFKEINDSLGHAAGDAALVALAERLRREVRPEDTVARLGGDEFVVIYPRLSSPADLEDAARRLVERIGEPIRIGDAVLRLRASAGHALFDHEVDDSHSLLMHADGAMYASKHCARPLP